MSERREWPKVIVFRVLPVVALLLGALAGFLKWQDASARGAQIAATESVAAVIPAAERWRAPSPMGSRTSSPSAWR